MTPKKREAALVQLTCALLSTGRYITHSDSGPHILFDVSPHEYGMVHKVTRDAVELLGNIQQAAGYMDDLWVEEQGRQAGERNQANEERMARADEEYDKRQKEKHIPQ